MDEPKKISLPQHANQNINLTQNRVLPNTTKAMVTDVPNLFYIQYIWKFP